ncbi:MAG: hypothetical protein KF773_27375 [Deltaproteobacteria bacterium]|nr:hypothetical protein [Deltaproteobacteria bacterium]
MTRVGPAAISAVLVGATLWPLARDPAKGDSFPLSTYPMFASGRPQKIAISYAIAETATGARRELTPAHLGTAEVMQAFVIVDGAIARGPAGTRALCQEVAVRVAGDADLAEVARVRIVTGMHDTVAYLVDGAPGTLTERARCQVRR